MNLKCEKMLSSWMHAPNHCPGVGMKLKIRLWNGFEEEGFFFYDTNEDGVVLTNTHPKDDPNDFVAYPWYYVKEWKYAEEV